MLLFGQIVSINAMESKSKSTLSNHSFLVFSPLQKMSYQNMLIVNKLNLAKELKVKKDTSSTLERKELKKDRQVGEGKRHVLKIFFGSISISSLIVSAYAEAIYPYADSYSIFLEDAKLFLVLGLICFIVFLILFINNKNRSARIRKNVKVGTVVN